MHAAVVTQFDRPPRPPDRPDPAPVGPDDIVAELAELAVALQDDDFAIDARAVPLADVEQAWVDAETATERIVVVPHPA